MSYTHFSKSDRLEISILLNRGYSHRDIAKSLEKHHSSISREILNHSVKGQYDPNKAQTRAVKKRRKSKYRGMRIKNNPDLESYVTDKIKRYWSPEQISGRIKNIEINIQYVSDINLQVSVQRLWAISVIVSLFKTLVQTKAVQNQGAKENQDP